MDNMTHTVSPYDSQHEAPMQQLTIRALEDDLEVVLRRTAKEHHTSLNKAALMLMRRGAGLEPEHADPQRVGDNLDRYLGSWTAEEAAAFDAATADLRNIDPEFWR